MEMLDIYDGRGNHIGQMDRERAHEPGVGVFYKCVHIWIIDDGRVLVQKRARCKREYPNKWDMAVAGHIDAGESPLNAAEREVFEEIGMRIPVTKFDFMGEILGASGNEYHQIYLIEMPIKRREMKLARNEVAAVKWLPFDKFNELFHSAKFVPHNEAYKDMVIEIIKRFSGK